MSKREDFGPAGRDLVRYEHALKQTERYKFQQQTERERRYQRIGEEHRPAQRLP